MNLTDKELGMIRALVRREAHELGYGTTYFSSGRRWWPRRLKDLTALIRKLNHELDLRRTMGKEPPF